MSLLKVHGASIRGVVTAVPGAPIQVLDLPIEFPLATARQIAQSAGLHQLHRAAPNQTAGDLGQAAAEVLLSRLGWERATVDALINVTQTPDHFSPATACILHHRLGLSSSCTAFDVNIACSGYVHGLLIAHQLAGSGGLRRVILVAGDTLSKALSCADQSTAILFGDASSATAIEQADNAPEVTFVTGTDGSGWNDLLIPGGGWRQPCSAENEAGNPCPPPQMHMDGLAVFNFTLKRVPECTRAAVEACGWQMSDVDAFYFHQANAFLLKTLATKLDIESDKVPVNIEKFGNTSMASIPLLLTDPISQKLLGVGPHPIVMVGFGAGFSWAAMAGPLWPLQLVDHVAI